MRREIERLNILFPETIPAHQRREHDNNAERSASRRDRFLWRWFHLWLWICIVRYRLERFYYQRFAARPCPTWPAIHETKVPFSDATVRQA
jgi:hypothetical protein